MTTHIVTLLFSDGVSHRLQASEGARLTEVAAAEGLTLLTDCSNGQCGTCVAQLCSGRVALGDYDRSVLSDDDVASGSILPCVAHVNDSCVVELPYEYSEACQDEPEPIKGRVVGITPVAEETVRLEVDVDEDVCFEAGQYVRMRPPGRDDWRSYSMANASGARHLDFFVRLVPGGVFSDWLAMGAAVGDVLELSAPRGSFFLRKEARPRLMVAGGTGLAPFLAMLSAIEREDELREQPTTLILGVRTAGHVFAREALDAWKARLPNLDVRVASEAGDVEGGHTGYPTDLIPSLGLEPRTRVYLCGPPPMVDAGRSACVKAGIARNEVLCERFA